MAPAGTDAAAVAAAAASQQQGPAAANGIAVNRQQSLSGELPHTWRARAPPLVISVSEPMKREQPGMFGIKGGYKQMNKCASLALHDGMMMCALQLVARLELKPKAHYFGVVKGCVYHSL